MSEPLSPERETEIRARAEAATEGPWWSDDSDACWRLHGVMFRHHGQVMNKQILKAPKHGTPYAEYWPEPADAEFIAHAREDVPALLAEVDRLRVELAKYVGHEPTVAEEMAHLSRCLDAVHAVCDAAEQQATRWEDPLPVPEWVATVRAAADGGRAE